MSPKRLSLAIFWLFAGTMHFIAPKFYDAIMPGPLKPWARQITYLSGVAEIAGGAAVLHPKTRSFARWWLLGTLAGVYPANIQMCLNSERYKNIPTWALWARLPLQFVAGYHVWKGTEE